MKQQPHPYAGRLRAQGHVKQAGRTSLFVAIGGVLMLSSCAALWTPDANERHSTNANYLHDVAVEAPHVEQLGHGPYARFVVCAGTACPSPTRKTLFAPPPTPATKPAPPPESVARPTASEMAAPPEPASPTAVNAVVRFDMGQSTLSPNAKLILSAAVARAEGESGSTRSKVDTLRVIGRTDSVGIQDVNDGLALARARVVRDYVLTKLHDLPSKVELEAKGSCCYTASNKTASGRRLNRRVELIFMRKGLAVGTIAVSSTNSSGKPSAGLLEEPPPHPPSDASAPDTADPIG